MRLRDGGGRQPGPVGAWGGWRGGALLRPLVVAALAACTASVCVIPAPPVGAHPAGGCDRPGHLGMGLHPGDSCAARCAEGYAAEPAGGAVGLVANSVNATANGTLTLRCDGASILHPPNFTCVPLALTPAVGCVVPGAYDGMGTHPNGSCVEPFAPAGGGGGANISASAVPVSNVANGTWLPLGSNCTARCAAGYAPYGAASSAGVTLHCTAAAAARAGAPTRLVVAGNVGGAVFLNFQCMNLSCGALPCWERRSRERPRLLGTCPNCRYSCEGGAEGCELGCRDGFAEVPAETVAGECVADGRGAARPFKPRMRVTCVAATCPSPRLDVGQAVASGCEPGGVLGRATCQLGCAAGYYPSTPPASCVDGTLPEGWRTAFPAWASCASVAAQFGCAFTHAALPGGVRALCPVTCNDCPAPPRAPDDDVWRPQPSCGSFCASWNESFAADRLPEGQVRINTAGQARLRGGAMELTPARANGVGRDMGVVLVDPGWDDELTSMHVGLSWSAYGGSGADGLSIHIAHRRQTAHWVSAADYRAFEETAVASGLSMLADELEGTLAIQIDGVEVARRPYSGGRGLRLEVDWDPRRLLLRVEPRVLSLELPANGSTPPLRPGDGWVVTAAARTGLGNNIHSVANLSLARCYRDYARMRAALEHPVTREILPGGSGLCLPNTAAVRGRDGGSLYAANSTASYHVHRPYCAASTCAPPTLATGQRVVGGCAAGGTLGASTCTLGCVAGYTASASVTGRCLGVAGTQTSSYQGQAVVCTPDPCTSPLPSFWRATSLNGVSIYVNTQTGGQSFTRPLDGAIPNVHPSGGCVEGTTINHSQTCTPRCAAHYGPSETQLTCDGVRLNPSGLSTFTPPAPPPPHTTTFSPPVRVGTLAAERLAGRGHSTSELPRLHQLLGSAAVPTAGRPLDTEYGLRAPPPPPPRYLPTPVPRRPLLPAASLSLAVQLPSPCPAAACALLQPRGRWHLCGDTCVPRAACDECAAVWWSGDSGRTAFRRAALSGALERAITRQHVQLPVVRPSNADGRAQFVYWGTPGAASGASVPELTLAEAAVGRGVLEGRGTNCSAELSDGPCALLGTGALRRCGLAGCAPLAAADTLDVVLSGAPRAVTLPASLPAAAVQSGGWRPGGEGLRLGDGGVLLPLRGVAADAVGGCSQPAAGGGGGATATAAERWLCSSVALLYSSDEGLSWSYRGRIDWGGAVAPVRGPVAVAVAELGDGTVLAMVSVGANHTLRRTLSRDQGATWTALQETGVGPLTGARVWSVAPQLLVLPNGALVLSAGRPGLAVWVSVDGAGETFQRTDLAAAHNAGLGTRGTLAHHRFGGGSLTTEPVAVAGAGAETSGQTSLQLLECYGSRYWAGERCEFAVVYDRLYADGSATVWATRGTVWVQAPQAPFEFACEYCYASCFAVLQECPTCGSGRYPICSYAAVNYAYCDMDSSCTYDFNNAMAAFDKAYADEVSVGAVGDTPITIPLERANFAYDGAVFVDGTAKLVRGASMRTKAVFDRPLRVDITARSSGSDGGCLNFYMFPEEGAGRFTGLMFGGGWWNSCLGSGFLRSTRRCATGVSAAVSAETPVVLRGHRGASTCLQPAGAGAGAPLAATNCTASVAQRWVHGDQSGAPVFRSLGSAGQCLRVQPFGNVGRLSVGACDASDARQRFTRQLHAYCASQLPSHGGGWHCVHTQGVPDTMASASSAVGPPPSGSCLAGGLGCPSQAFDGRLDDGGAGDRSESVNFWHSDEASGLPQWLAYDLGRPTALCSYALVARRAGCCHAADSPRDWELRGLDPGAAAAAGGATVRDGWAVADVRSGEAGWGSGERRVYELLPGVPYQIYRLHVTGTGHGARVVLAEMELHALTAGGDAASANFSCSGGGPRWAAAPAADFGVDHTYSLDLRSDGVVDFRFDGALVRSWQDDGRLKYGTVGAGNQCAESTISSITVFQRCRVTIHIHVNGSGFDTRWNVDQLPALTFGPDTHGYAARPTADFYHHVELTSGRHTLNAYAIVASAGWGAGSWSVRRGWWNHSAGGTAVVEATTVHKRGSSTNFDLTCGATTDEQLLAAPATGVCSLCPIGTYADAECESRLPLAVSSSMCRRCPAGKYAAVAGARSCQTCAVGQFSAAGSPRCSPLCPAGSAPQLTEPCLRACTECRPGHFSNGTADCLPCAPGSYSESGARPVCAACPVGRFSSSPAAPRCTACPAGRAAPALGAALCGVCAAGRYAPAASRACVRCPAGRASPYASAPHLGSCAVCPAGRHALTGSSFCPLCARGYYSIAGQERCTICAVGRYNALQGGEPGVPTVSVVDVD